MEKYLSFVQLDPSFFTATTFQMAVVKTGEDIGALVWVGANPAQGGQMISLMHSGITVFSAGTVGHLYGLAPTIEWQSIVFGTFEPSEDLILQKFGKPYYESWDEDGMFENAEIKELYMKMMEPRRRYKEKYVGEPIRKACEELGIKKLIKHGGDFPSKLEGLEIEVISRHTRYKIDMK